MDSLLARATTLGRVAIGILALDRFCSPHRGEHRISAGLGLAIKKDREFSPLAVSRSFTPILSASRLTASQVGFFIVSQSGERPERYGESFRFDTMLSSPSLSCEELVQQLLEGILPRPPGRRSSLEID